MPTSPSLDSPALRSGFLPSILSLRAQGGPIALVDRVGNAIHKAREQEVLAGTATWGLFGVALQIWEARMKVSAQPQFQGCPLDVERKVAASSSVLYP